MLGHLNRRGFLTATAGTLAAAVIPLRGAAAQGISTPITGVIELFTSQGCSSCPPADALLHSYAQRDDVLALGFHVDYWDYLGWKDTLASAENTQRQHAYRQALGNRSVYTPQAMVNGTHDLVGSHGNKIDAALNNSPALPLNVTIAKPDDMHLHIAVRGNATTASPATVSIVYFASSTTVPVARGENAGHELTYANAVRYFTTLGAWSGEDLDMQMPASEIAKQNADGCAIIVQQTDAQGRPGAILGAAKFVAAMS